MDTILNKIHVPIDQMFNEDPGHLSHSAFLPVYNNCASWVIFTVAHFLHNLSFQAELKERETLYRLFLTAK